MDYTTLMTSAIITVVFFIFKCIEVKLILKEELVIKTIMRETIFVYVTTCIGLFITEQVSLNVDSKIGSSGGASAFLGKPDF
jgi:hypothetical protein